MLFFVSLAVYSRKRLWRLIIVVLWWRRFVSFRCATVWQVQLVAVYDSLFGVGRDVASVRSESLRCCWPSDVGVSIAVVFRVLLCATGGVAEVEFAWSLRASGCEHNILWLTAYYLLVLLA